MAREQNHGRIEIVGLTGVPAIFDRGGQRVETGRKRRQARRIERLLESERDIVGHGIGSCLRTPHRARPRRSPSPPASFGPLRSAILDQLGAAILALDDHRSDEHTSELQSLMRTSYAVICLTKNK